MPTYKVMRKVLGHKPADIIVSDNPFYANMALKGHLVIIPDESETLVEDLIGGDTEVVNDVGGEEASDGDSGDEPSEPTGRSRRRHREGTNPGSDPSAEPGSSPSSR